MPLMRDFLSETIYIAIIVIFLISIYYFVSYHRKEYLFAPFTIIFICYTLLKPIHLGYLASIVIL